jgi:hypothetical protein
MSAQWPLVLLRLDEKGGSLRCSLPGLLGRAFERVFSEPKDSEVMPSMGYQDTAVIEKASPHSPRRISIELQKMLGWPYGSRRRE